MIPKQTSCVLVGPSLEIPYQLYVEFFLLHHVATTDSTKTCSQIPRNLCVPH